MMLKLALERVLQTSMWALLWQWSPWRAMDNVPGQCSRWNLNGRTKSQQCYSRGYTIAVRICPARPVSCSYQKDSGHIQSWWPMIRCPEAQESTRRPANSKKLLGCHRSHTQAFLWASGLDWNACRWHFGRGARQHIFAIFLPLDFERVSWNTWCLFQNPILRALIGRELPGNMKGMVDQVSQAHRVLSTIPKKCTDMGFWFACLQKAPSSLLFPAHTSMFRALSPPYWVLGLSIHDVCRLTGPTIPSGTVVPTSLEEPTTKW